jgi:hypothetical protein
MSPPLVLEAAIRNRVFDVLDKGAKTVPQLAAETGASERGLSAIMNALVGLNFLAKDPQGRYSLTPESATFLVSTKPGFMGGEIRHGSEQLIPRWLHLSTPIRLTPDPSSGSTQTPCAASVLMNSLRQVTSEFNEKVQLRRGS